MKDEPTLRARVARVTGNTHHFAGRIENGALVQGAELPVATWVEIEFADGAYYLMYLDETLSPITDTWHQTIEDAKAQAAFEFDIREDEWVTV